MRLVFALILVLLAYGPLLAEFGANLWSRPYYQHFPYVILAAGLLVWRSMSRQSEEPITVPAAMRIGLGALACGLLLVAYWGASPLLAAVSFLLLVGYFLAGWSACLRTDFPLGSWLLLWLLIPLPLGLDLTLMETLQQSSSRLSSRAMDLLGVNHLMQGNVLVLPDKNLFVDEACSGIVSVVSIIACAALYGVWRRRSFMHIILLMASAAGWATVLNVVRITSIALAFDAWRVDWSSGVAHTLLGLAIFALSLAALVLTDWLWNALLAPIGDRFAELHDFPIQHGALLVSAWDGAAGDRDADDDSATPTQFEIPAIPAALLIALGLLGGGQFLIPRPVEAELTRASSIDPEAFATAIERIGMPLEFEGLKQTGMHREKRRQEAEFGENSVIFEYESPQNERYLVSCDFPYNHAWHDLSWCYQGVGWTLADRQICQMTPAVAPESAAGEYAELELLGEEGTQAWVAFCAYDFAGRVVQAPRTDLVSNLAAKFLSRDNKPEQRETYQVQVLVERLNSVSAHDRVMGRKLLAEARGRFLGATISPRQAGAQRP